MISFYLQKNPVSREIKQLLKIAASDYSENKKYDVVIADKIPKNQNFKALVLVKKNLNFNSDIPILETDLVDLCQKGLNFNAVDYTKPLIEEELFLIKEFCAKNTVLAEIPPVSFGKTFFVVLSHDIDHLSLHGMHFERSADKNLDNRTFFEKIKSFLANHKSLHDKTLGFFALFKGGIWKDINNFEKINNIEKNFNLSSTYFFAPFKQKGISYDLKNAENHINFVKKNNNEIACHSVSGQNSLKHAVNEKKIVEKFAPVKGNRVHHLDFESTDFLKNFEKAGYLYDSSLGLNKKTGFPCLTTQPFVPLNCEKLMEFPLNVQDGSLFKSNAMNLSFQKAKKHCFNFMTFFQKFGGQLVLDWHNVFFNPQYSSWEKLYIELIKKSFELNALPVTMSECFEFFNERRNSKILHNKKSNSNLFSFKTVPKNKMFLRIWKNKNLVINAENELNISESKKCVDILCSDKTLVTVSSKN